MDKHEELIAKETVLRTIAGNIETAKLALRNIDTIIWMHPEICDYIDIDHLLKITRVAIEELKDHVNEHISRDQEVEQAIFEKYGDII